MCNVQTQSLYNVTASFLEGACHILEGIRGKQFAVFLKVFDILIAKKQIFSGDILSVGIFCKHGMDDVILIGVFKHGNHIISYLVYCMNRARAGI